MARELQENEVFIDIKTNEIVLPTGDRYCITDSEEVFVEQGEMDYKRALLLFELEENALILYLVELGIGRAEQVPLGKLLRSGGTN